MVTPLHLSPVYARAREYESHLDSDFVDKEGVFYTPLSLVQEMVTRGIAIVGKDSPVVLDPACGAGIFLLAAFDHLLLQNGTPPNLSVGKKVLAEQIYGIDRDMNAILLCGELLLSRFVEWFGVAPEPEVERSLRAHLIGADTLLESNLFNPSHPCFDLVVGNPPYGLSRGGKMSEVENKALKERFASIRSGKLDKYLAFIARGLELCAPHGALSFVVPNSWLGIKGGKPIRELLLRSGALREIHTFEEKIFDIPGVEAIVFYAVKELFAPSFTITRRGKYGDSSFTLTTEECLQTPDFLIPLFWDTSLREIFNQVDRDAFLLGDKESPFIPLIALQAYSEGKGDPPQTKKDVENHTFHSPTCTGKDSLPYLEGRDIGRYFKLPHRSWIQYGPWLSEHQPIERYQGPRIAIREIVGGFPTLAHATYLDETAIYNRSILHILPKVEATESDLLILLAVLNSALGSLILFYRGRKTQRTLFPKIVNDDLKAFPLPHEFRVRGSRIPALVRQILNRKEKMPHDLETAINQEVFNLYELSSVQRENITRLTALR